MILQLDDTELAVIRALAEDGVAYYVGGLFGASLRGMDVTPRQIDLYVADRARFDAAALRAGVTPDRQMRVHTYSHPDRFEQQYALTREVKLRDVVVRVQSLEGIRDDVDYFCGAHDARDFFAAIANQPAPPPSVEWVPETDLGTFIGESLRRAIDRLHSFGYVESSSRRPGTYCCYFDNDVDPRTGTSSAGISVYEDPARPVIHTFRNRL